MKTRCIALAVVFGSLLLGTQARAQVTKESVQGITNFSRLQTTVACAGATKVEAIPEIKKMGFVSIINLREATEQGADVEAEAAAAKAVGLKFVHLPFNGASPSPDVVDRFLATITTAGTQPAFIHCAGAGRAATMWMIKRMQIDRWDEQRAVEEATALGLSNERLKQFALNYVNTHKR